MFSKVLLTSLLFAASFQALGFGTQADTSIIPFPLNDAAYSVKIVEGFEAEETWHVTGVCSRSPDEIVRFLEDHEHDRNAKRVAVVFNASGYFSEPADRIVCINTPAALSHNLQKKLGLL